MASTLSPNMSLIVPTVGSEPGPNYAQDINNSLGILDGHNHTNGSGVQITPLALNINTALTFNGNAATSISALTFQTMASDQASGSLYVKLGAESTPLNDLFYNDGTNVVQITKGGLINATVASIPGESYGSGTFTWKQGAGSTVPANFDIGAVTIRPNTAATTFGITLLPPAAIASAYSLVLPALPSSLAFLSLDNSGNIRIADQITTAQIADGAVTLPKQASRPVSTTVGIGGISRSSITGGVFSIAAGAAAAIPGWSNAITTSGRPTMIGIAAVGGTFAAGDGPRLFVNQSPFVSSPSLSGIVQIFRDSTVVATFEFGTDISLQSSTPVTSKTPTTAFVATGSGGSPTTALSISTGGVTTTESVNITFPPPGFFQLDAVSAGTYTYTGTLRCAGGTNAAIVQCDLVVYEI